MKKYGHYLSNIFFLQSTSDNIYLKWYTDKLTDLYRKVLTDCNKQTCVFYICERIGDVSTIFWRRTPTSPCSSVIFLSFQTNLCYLLVCPPPPPPIFMSVTEAHTPTMGLNLISVLIWSHQLIYDKSRDTKGCCVKKEALSKSRNYIIRSGRETILSLFKFQEEGRMVMRDWQRVQMKRAWSEFTSLRLTSWASHTILWI